MALPTKKTKQEVNVNAMIMMIYGSGGTGKTTIANSFGNVLFMHSDPGLKFINAYKYKYDSWKKFKKGVAELKEDYAEKPKRYDAIAIDTIGQLYNLCKQHICKENNVDYPGDMTQGKGWDILATEFNTEILKLTNYCQALIFIAHARTEEARGTFITTKKVYPDMQPTPRRYIFDLCDVVGYVGFSENGKSRRKLYFNPTDDRAAKDRGGLFKNLVIPEEDKDNAFKLLFDSILKGVGKSKSKKKKTSKKKSISR